MRIPFDPEDAERTRDVLSRLGIKWKEVAPRKNEASVIVAHKAEIHPAKTIAREGKKWRVTDPRIVTFIIDKDVEELVELVESIDSTLAKDIRVMHG